MSRFASAALSGVSSFTVAYLVGSRLRNRRTGLFAGVTSGTVAAAASWVAYGFAEAVERHRTTDNARESAADGW